MNRLFLERLGVNVNKLDKHQFCHKVKYQFIFKDFLSHRLRGKTKIFSHGNSEDVPPHRMLSVSKSCLCMKKKK